MERFVKNFIGASIMYLIVASVLGLLMLCYPSLLTIKFVHSHLNMLGWVSMMIYGVGYHILPKFAGKKIKSVKLGELQFYLANIGLIGMLLFYTLDAYNPSAGIYRIVFVLFGIIEAVSVVLFFYNMMATLYGREQT